MPNKEKIEEQQKKVEEVKETSTEKGEAEKKPVTEQKEEKVEEKKTEETEKAVEGNADDKKEEEAEEDEGKVVEKEVQGANAIRVEDIVTKEELNEKMQAFEAKFLALAEENKQLKDELAKEKEGKEKAETETEALKNKYERSDFGNIATKGAGSNSDKGSSYQSFDEYSKNFN